MNRISRICISLAVCVLVLLALNALAFACQVDEFYLTKEGGLAAVSNETLAEASADADRGRNDRLSAMVASRQVLKLKGEEKVQVLERSLDWKTLKIKFTNGEGPYWVRESSLKRIESR